MELYVRFNTAVSKAVGTHRRTYIRSVHHLHGGRQDGCDELFISIWNDAARSILLINTFEAQHGATIASVCLGVVDIIVLCGFHRRIVRIILLLSLGSIPLCTIAIIYGRLHRPQ